ncbi:MAG: chromate transporter [Pseudazoarcus pumilus]|nr:chromate transporter [Pseudazoarcus pumilus]
MNEFLLSELPEFVLRFMMLSLLSVGGAMSTAPEMHRYLVGQSGWLDNTEFTTSIAIAQAAPGPNLLFVAVLGYQVFGTVGAAAALISMLLPSTIVTLAASRWGRARRDTLGVRAFIHGLAPMTISLLVAAGSILALPFINQPDQRIGGLLLIGFTLAAMLKTRVSPIWLIAAGAAFGALGGV